MKATHWILVALLLAPNVAAAAQRGLALRLGRPKVMAHGRITVPIELVNARASEVAALNFTLRYDPGLLAAEPSGIRAGRAVRGARAELAGAVDPDSGIVRVLVVPEFSAQFGALRGRKVAMVTFQVLGRMPDHPGRWLRRQLKLERVVLGDRAGRELPAVAR